MLAGFRLQPDRLELPEGLYVRWRAAVLVNRYPLGRSVFQRFDATPTSATFPIRLTTKSMSR